MSIVTTAQAVPSRLFAIYATLFDSENGELKDRIEAWATPLSIRPRSGESDGEPTTTLFSNTLAEAFRVGLVEEIDDKLRLTEDARGGGKKGQDSETYFLAYMRRTLFDPARAEECRHAGFMIAMSWFLSSSPLRPMSFSEPPQNVLASTIGDYAKTELTSLNRYQNFIYWAQYLGFATIVGGSGDADDLNSRRVIPNPIKAIENALPIIFNDDNDLLIEQFMLRLSAIFPVFETGSVRKEFESMRRMPVTNSDERLSISTSVALQRLVDRQRLTLTSVADAKPRILDFGAREGRVSHVALKVAA